MASQLMADLYGCDPQIVDDPEQIKAIARRIISEIGAEIVEECVHEFEPIGVTYFAVITTSHFSVHTWPEYNYAAVDIFSCSEDVPDRILKLLKEAFKAESIDHKLFERQLVKK